MTPGNSRSRKLTDDMLMQAIANLPPERRRQSDILVEVKRVYGIKISRSTLSIRMRDSGVMIAVEQHIKRLREAAVIASVMGVKIGELQSQVANLNKAEDAIGRLIDYALEGLSNDEEKTINGRLGAIKAAAEVMSVSADVRAKMASTHKLATPEPEAATGETPATPAAANVFSIAEMRERYGSKEVQQ